jgi:hypothetical protein
MQNYDGVSLKGVYTMRTWPKGVLQALLAAGLSLAEAQAASSPVYERMFQNLVTDTGKQLAARFMTGEEDAFLVYHAIGTSDTAPAASDTALGAEVARKRYVTKSSDGAEMTFSVFYLSTESARALEECGWFGGDEATETALSGVLFSRVLEAFDNSAGLYDLTFDYVLTVL